MAIRHLQPAVETTLGRETLRFREQKSCRQQEHQQHQQQDSNRNGKLLKKKQATGGDCGDDRDSNSRKKVEAVAARRDSNDWSREVLKKANRTINQQQNDCNKEQQAALQWHFNAIVQ